MAEDLIEISTTTLDKNIAEISVDLKGVRSDLKGMFDSILQLDAMWDGPANDAFNKQYRIDHEALNAICGAVDHLIDCMEFASGEYNKCESSIGASIAAIRV